MTRNIPAQQPTSEPPSKVQYAHEVVQQVACGIVRHQGFDSIESSALITLTEVMERYIIAIGQSGRAFSDIAARTQGNLADLRMAFIDLSVDVPALCRYADSNRAGIFETPLPKFPLDAPTLPNSTAITSSVLGEHRPPRPPHIPKHCPPMPPAHTYISTPIYAPHVRETGSARMQKTREKRQVESALGTFAVRTKMLPAKRIKEDVAVLTTPKAPQYLAALLGQNGVNVDNIHIDLPPKPGPGIVVSAVDDDDMGLDLSPPPLSPAPSPAPLPAK